VTVVCERAVRFKWQAAQQTMKRSASSSEVRVRARRCLLPFARCSRSDASPSPRLRSDASPSQKARNARAGGARERRHAALAAAGGAIIPRCAAVADQLPVQAIPDLAPLKKLKVPELRTLCGTNNVSSVGTKDTLVQRLDALRKSSAEAGAAGKTISVASASTTAARSGAATPVVNSAMTPKQRAGNDACRKSFGHASVPASAGGRDAARCACVARTNEPAVSFSGLARVLWACLIVTLPSRCRRLLPEVRR
jgi:hypothetical protein